MAMRGFVRNFPPLNILSDEDIENVHRGMLRVLWTTGVRLEHKRALDVLESAGCKVDRDSNRVRMPPALVEECIRKAPSSFSWRAKDPANSLMMGGNTLYFAPAPGQNTIDLDTYEPRPATRKEYYDAVRVLDYLPTLHFFTTYTPYFGYAGVPPCMGMLESLAARLRNSSKAVVVGHSHNSERWAIQIAQALGIEVMGTCTAAPPLTYFEDAIDSAFSLAEAGMAGIVPKNHDLSTVGIAREAEEAAPGVRMLDGLTLNESARGVSPDNVANALAAGAKIIWLPTKDGASDPRGKRRLVENGRVGGALEEIFELIAADDAVLASAHVAADEVLPLVQAAAARGVRRLLVNHPEIPFLDYPVELQQDLRDAGALLERCYPRPEAVDGFAQIAAQIEAAGVESTILATDLGRRDLLPPIDGLRRLLLEMAARGFSQQELKRMAAANPVALITGSGREP